MINELINQLDKLLSIAYTRELTKSEKQHANTVITQLEYEGYNGTAEFKSLGGSIPGYVVKITNNNNQTVFDKLYPT